MTKEESSGHKEATLSSKCKPVRPPLAALEVPAIPPWSRGLQAFLGRGLLSAKGFFLVACLLLLLFALHEWIGLRDFVSILSGTAPFDRPLRQPDLLAGISYTLSYFGAVLLAPIFLLASLLLGLFDLLSKP